jgi:hypothetical protein
MVLEPIEQMIEKVKQISQNPIEALQRNEKEEITKALLEEEENNATCSCSKGKDKNSKNIFAPPDKFNQYNLRKVFASYTIKQVLKFCHKVIYKLNFSGKLSSAFGKIFLRRGTVLKLITI